MIKPFWPLAVNTWQDEEMAAAHHVINSGHLTMGEEVAAFEHEFAAYFGSRHAVMTNSGSSANLLAVAIARHKIKRNVYYEEAVVPAIAWATTYAPLNQHKFSLRVVDIDPATLNTTIDRVLVARDTNNTRILLGCSILGNPAPVDIMRTLADLKGLFFIEDNCESMGAKIEEKFCGTFGHIGTFSTFFSHQINTGEGGMLVTDDDELHDLALCLRAHGWSRNLPENSSLRTPGEVPGDYQFLLPGYNLRPTEIAAAVGRVQLRRLANMNAQRQLNAHIFTEQFGGDQRWQIQEPGRTGACAVPFGFTLVFPNARECALAKQRLSDSGIEYRMITGGCFTEHPAAKHYAWSSSGDLPNAKHAHYCGLFVGNHPFDLSMQIEKMAEVLK